MVVEVVVEVVVVAVMEVEVGCTTTRHWDLPIRPIKQGGACTEVMRSSSSRGERVYTSHLECPFAPASWRHFQ